MRNTSWTYRVGTGLGIVVLIVATALVVSGAAWCITALWRSIIVGCS